MTSAIRKANHCAIQLFHSFMRLGDGSDVGHSIYSREVFMTKFVVHPEAIIQGELLRIKTVAINR